MKAIGAFHRGALRAATLLLLTCRSGVLAFSFSRVQTTTRSHAGTALLATVVPSESTTVGTVGSGYVSILLSKLAAHRRHGKSWIICPDAEADSMRELVGASSSSAPANWELVPASDNARVEELLGETDALLVATDDVGSVVGPTILTYLLDPEKCSQMKRVVAMSRNLNGEGMGFFVSASRTAANAQVWDNAYKDAFRSFEADVQNGARGCGADWTVVRAGTLKGGASGPASEEGEVAYPQYLNESFYGMTKNDIVAWQMLFDVDVRGVSLTRGDVLPGPGARAVFTATGSGEHQGDSGRCGVAEAMVRSLEEEGAANVDFAVGTKAGTEAPSEEEWETLFRGCLS